jgi:hypothetical protein
MATLYGNFSSGIYPSRCGRSMANRGTIPMPWRANVGSDRRHSNTACRGVESWNNVRSTLVALLGAESVAPVSCIPAVCTCIEFPSGCARFRVVDINDCERAKASRRPKTQLHYSPGLAGRPGIRGPSMQDVQVALGPNEVVSFCGKQHDHLDARWTASQPLPSKAGPGIW